MSYTPYSEQFHRPGYVYCILAVGYGGIIPGCWTKRVKIGLSNSPERRVHELAGTQPPCNFRIIHTIYVADMATVEGELQAHFEHKHIKLDRSTEWFDLNPLEIKYLVWLMNRYQSRTLGISYKHALIGTAIALGIGITGTTAVNYAQSTNNIEVIEAIKNETN